MLKIDRRSWHYRLVRWAWGSDKWGVYYLLGLTLAIPSWRRDMRWGIGEPFDGPNGLCAYLWMLLTTPLLIVATIIVWPLFSLLVDIVYWGTKALLWVPLLLIRVLAATPPVSDKAASTWRIVGEGAKAAHTRTCPRIEYVGGEQKEGVA